VKMTPKTGVTTLLRFALWFANESKESQQWLCDRFNEWLDSEDFGDVFGTERQSDPRGDGRG
jgi:hypothetical protein